MLIFEFDSRFPNSLTCPEMELSIGGMEGTVPKGTVPELSPDPSQPSVSNISEKLNSDFGGT
jgi:hypothetical protein